MKRECLNKSLRINNVLKFCIFNVFTAGPSDRAVKGVGLRPLACWDCGFESHRENWCFSLVSVVCCQVEVSAISLINRPEEFYWMWCVVVCDLETSWMRDTWPTEGCRAKSKNVFMPWEVRLLKPQKQWLDCELLGRNNRLWVGVLYLPDTEYYQRNLWTSSAVTINPLVLEMDI